MPSSSSIVYITFFATISQILTHWILAIIHVLGHCPGKKENEYLRYLGFWSKAIQKIIRSVRARLQCY